MGGVCVGWEDGIKERQWTRRGEARARICGWPLEKLKGGKRAKKQGRSPGTFVEPSWYNSDGTGTARATFKEVRKQRRVAPASFRSCMFSLFLRTPLIGRGCGICCTSPSCPNLCSLLAITPATTVLYPVPSPTAVHCCCSCCPRDNS